RLSGRTVGKQRHLSGPVHGGRDDALMPGTSAGSPERQDLVLLVHEPLDGREVLVVDVLDVAGAEGTDLLLDLLAELRLLLSAALAALFVAALRLCHLMNPPKLMIRCC